MSASAASLQCPICFHSGVFETAESLRNRLIFVSTNKLSCPVCQEEVIGLDKLTIHLFSHVKLSQHDVHLHKNISENFKTIVNKNCELEQNSVNSMEQKKPTKATVPKNKTTTASTNQPVKFVKIYPKLPVVSANAVTTLNMKQLPIEEGTQICNPLNIPSVKTEINTICNICGLQFIDTNILRMHRCLIHNIEENSSPTLTRYDCHLCTKNFKMRGSLMVHLRVAHYGFTSGNGSTVTNTSIDASGAESASDNTLSLRNDGKQWQCDVCQKCFTTKYFLKKHKRLHTGETPYSCAQCSKTFTFQQSYHKHLLYHNDEKPHVCNYCGRAFKELSTLHNHQRIHTGEKPFSCETCGKCFRQRVSYLVHRRIHTGVMPYKCTACDKSFRYKVSQRTHKCQAQPPGTVIRNAGDLVEKLKKKHAVITDRVEEMTQDHNESDIQGHNCIEVSEANAELVRCGAKLSFEDTETDNFTLIADAFAGEAKSSDTLCKPINENIRELIDSNFEDLIDAIPFDDKNVPSPSDILKKLCLTQDEDIVRQSENTENYEILREFM